MINIGTRQQNRSLHADIIHTDYTTVGIATALAQVALVPINPSKPDFGTGNSAQLFLDSLKNTDIWQLNHQKQFRDI